MPVRKMRDIAEAVAPLAAPMREENLRSAFELSDAALRMHAQPSQRGVRRYRSLEEAQAARSARPSS